MNPFAKSEGQSLGQLVSCAGGLDSQGMSLGHRPFKIVFSNLLKTREVRKFRHFLHIMGLPWNTASLGVPGEGANLF